MKVRGLLIAFGLVAGLACPAAAITVAIDPTSTSVGVGANVDVDVDIAGLGAGSAPSLGAFSLTVTFDPSLLAFTSAVFGTGLVVDPSTDNFPTADDSTPGQITLTELSLESMADLNAFQPSDFALATLSFTGLAAGTSPLGLSINELVAADATTLTADVVTGGSITVAAAGTAVPEPATLILLTPAVAAIAAQYRSLRRRQRRM